jgi:hypothetical protein
VAAGSSPTGFAQDPAMYLSQPYPSLGYSLPDTNPTNGQFNAGYTVSPDANRPGYVQNYNFSIQYLLPKSIVLETAFVGNKGTRLWGFPQYDVNPATKLSIGDPLLDPVSSHPQYSPYAGYPTDQTVAQAMLPYPQFYQVNDFFAYNAGSNYNALQVTVTKHLTKGFGFLAAYTFSKTIGYQDSLGAMGYGTPQDYYNRGLERAVATFNFPQSFKLTWSWDIPVGRGHKADLGWANAILGGWQLSGIHNYIAGGPIALYSSGLSTPSGFGSIRPDVLGTADNLSNGGIGTADWSVPTQWLKQDQFANVPTSPNGVPLRVGTAPRNTSYLSNPKSLNETLRLSKGFNFANEKANFRVGMTMWNPLKRTWPYVVDTTVGDSAFGQILQTGGDRTMQLDARITF